MSNTELVVGVLAATERTGPAAMGHKLRDFTIACSRFDYSGPLIEGTSVVELLTRARAAGATHCFVQACGHATVRYRDQASAIDTNFFKELATWTARPELFVAGRMGEHGLDDLRVLVNLDDWAKFGSPDVANLVAAGKAHGKPLIAFEGPILKCAYDLRPKSEADVATFLACRGEGILNHEPAGCSDDWRAFIEFVKYQARHAKRGVFLGNWESYTDIETPPPSFRRPVSAVYSVAAGFKTNRILETHGFDDETEVVYYDYSQIALAIRKTLVEEWDGHAFPEFMISIAGRFPDAFYQLWGLWGDTKPGSLIVPAVVALWQKEIAAWGSEAAFADHWQRTRRLRHHYVHADLFARSQPLEAQIRAKPGGVIWWSNAFHSLNSVWFYDRDERHAIYQRWITTLNAIAPDLLIYGKDVDNLEIGGTQISDHVRPIHSSR